MCAVRITFSRPNSGLSVAGGSCSNTSSPAPWITPVLSAVNKASCLGLLSNAAVLWNTVQIEHMVGRLRAGGAEIDPADLAHVWPLQHARIIPNGTYFLGWPQSNTPEMALVPSVIAFAVNF